MVMWIVFSTSWDDVSCIVGVFDSIGKVEKAGRRWAAIESKTYGSVQHWYTRLYTHKLQMNKRRKKKEKVYTFSSDGNVQI